MASLVVKIYGEHVASTGASRSLTIARSLAPAGELAIRRTAAYEEAAFGDGDVRGAVNARQHVGAIVRWLAGRAKRINNLPAVPSATDRFSQVFANRGWNPPLFGGPRGHVFRNA